MAEVIGVRFKEVGKIYYFDPDGQELKKGDRVIVETVRGVECGEVALENREISDEEIVKPLKKLIRKADEKDLRTLEENKKKEKNAFGICQKKIADHKLDMKLVDVEYTFDGGKVLFYFTADGRVDFRELVKDLAGVFRTRIELPRHLRAPVLLPQLPRRFPARFDKNGQGAGAFAEPHQNKRHLRQTHVLPQIRAECL